MCPVCNAPAADREAIDASLREHGVRPTWRRWPAIKLTALWKHSKHIDDPPPPPAAPPPTEVLAPAEPRLPARPFAPTPNPGDDALTAPRKVVSAIVESRCVELRMAGRSYAEIASALGIDSDTAEDTVERYLIRTARGTNKNADAARALEVARLERVIAGLWTRATDPDRSKQTIAAKPTEGGEATGGAEVYDESQDKGVDRLLRAMERKAKLLGLDAPTVQVSLEHPKVRDELERAFRELLGLVTAALKPHPAALRDVLLAMRRWRAQAGLDGDVVEASA